MLLLACLFVGIGLVTAQTQKVTGVVISEEDGQPVVGASVLVKGTTQGTITDVDGNFNLANVPSSAKTLQISYIGMQTQEVVIKPTLKVVLKSDSQNLDEVVVTAMGIKRSEKSLGYAVSIVKGDEKSLSIAAASILAKVTRDHWMKKLDEMYPQYGLAKHKGYPTKAHIEALNQYGLQDFYRRSYGPVKKLEEIRLF